MSSASQPQLPSDGPADCAEISCPDEPIPDPHASLCAGFTCRRSVQHHRHIAMPLQGNLNLRLFADYFTTALDSWCSAKPISIVCRYVIIITAGDTFKSEERTVAN